jgi:hypothetical protein
MRENIITREIEFVTVLFDMLSKIARVMFFDLYIRCRNFSEKHYILEQELKKSHLFDFNMNSIL